MNAGGYTAASARRRLKRAIRLPFATASVEIASAVDRTAKDAPQAEHRTSTRYSTGCWVKEFLLQ
jgi:hypothetical protein